MSEVKTAKPAGKAGATSPQKNPPAKGASPKPAPKSTPEKSPMPVEKPSPAKPAPKAAAESPPAAKEAPKVPKDRPAPSAASPKKFVDPQLSTDSLSFTEEGADSPSKPSRAPASRGPGSPAILPSTAPTSKKGRKTLHSSPSSPVSGSCTQDNVETPLEKSTSLMPISSVSFAPNKSSVHNRTLSHDDAVYDTTRANYSMSRAPPEMLQRSIANESMHMSFTQKQLMIPRPTINAKRVGVAEPVIVTDHNYLEHKENIAALEQGKAIFSFTCCNGKMLSQDEKEQGDLVINLSSFPDETVDNNVPYCNLFDDKDAKKYSIIFNKCAYLLPGVPLSKFTPQLISSYDYQKACQPGDPHIWSDFTEDNTFRMTKTIIRFLYSVTIQFKVSRIDDKILPTLSRLAGLPVDVGLLLERTKRDVAKEDATAKAKSILLYSKVEGGVLVTNLTVVLNRALPTIVAKLMNNFSASGAAEVCETATRTREWFGHKKVGK